MTLAMACFGFRTRAPVPYNCAFINLSIEVSVISCHLQVRPARLWIRGTRYCATAICFLLALIFLAGTCVAQQEVVSEYRDPRQSPDPGRHHSRPHVHQSWRRLRPGRAWNATSTPCGTPAISTICASSANDSAKGWIIHVYVKEKPTIREIKYAGLSSVSQSDVLDKFKEQKVGLTQESQYDPTKVKRAEVVIKQLLAAHGHQFATVRSEVRPIPPAAVVADLRGERRPEGQGRQDQVRRQQGDQESRAAKRDEEPEAHRHPALDLPGEPVRAHLRFHQADGRRRARSLLLPDQGLLQGAGWRSQDADPRHQRRQVVLPVQVVAGQSGRYHAAGGRRPALPVEEKSPSPATRR